MGRSKETFNKKEVRDKKMKKRKEKEKRRLEKKEQGKSDFDDMIAYVDENGQLSDTPPDETKKEEVKAENIEISTPKGEFRDSVSVYQGVVRNYNDEKGFGFISTQKLPQTVFVHVNDCKVELKEGLKVEFEVEKGVKGLKAINVKSAN